MRFRLVVVLFLAALSAFGADTLRVMTYNVRYPAKSDGPDLWDLRRDILVRSLQAKDPDLFGTQELYHLQGEYIVGKLPAYSWFGVSRRGNREDEFMGVFYKRDKLKLVDSGNFWLSETPETPGSISWNMSLPRMVTWGLFEIKASGKRFYYYNTHFAHRREDEPARMESARLLASRIRQVPAAVPFLLTGDFNAPAGGPVYDILAAFLADARKAAATRNGPEGTFHGFKGKPTGPRIDWIFYRGPFSVREAETVTFNENGRYPSDHFPVLAVMKLD